MSDITWADKVDGAVGATGKFIAADANEIKTAVNSKLDSIPDVYYGTRGDVHSLFIGGPPMGADPSGTYNLAIGTGALAWVRGGAYNTVFGSAAASYVNDSSGLCAIGYNALRYHYGSSGITAVGQSVDKYNSRSFNNCFFGSWAATYYPVAIGAAAPATGTDLEIGKYYYRVAYYGSGFSAMSPEISVFTTEGNQNVDLSGIPIYDGPLDFNSRIIYRTKVNPIAAVGGTTDYQFFVVGNLWNNTATTFTDNTPDASLTTPFLGPSNSIAIGAGATIYAAGEAVFGSSGSPFMNAYFGSGRFAPTPAAVTLHSSGGSGTNNAGADFGIAGGKGTGSAKGGDIVFSTAPAGAAGSIHNALEELLRITGDSKIAFNGVTPVTRPVLATGAGATVDNVIAVLQSLGLVSQA